MNNEQIGFHASYLVARYGHATRPCSQRSRHRSGSASLARTAPPGRGGFGSPVVNVVGRSGLANKGATMAPTGAALGR